jgi:4-hydroxy-tetrahydrodipicolinate reductase
VSRMRIAIVGVPGRMAQRIASVSSEADDVEVTAAIGRAGSSSCGQKLSSLGGFPDLDIVVTDGLAPDAQNVVIDFSGPAATRLHIRRCVELNLPLLIGTTGLSETDEALIDEAANSIAVLTASNTSLGVNLLEGLVEQMAKTLGPDYDIEMVESHHKWKKDAPSGTALFLAKAAARGLGQELTDCAQNGREGGDALRKPGEIGIHALRMGDVVGEHRVYFSTQGERIELGHIATSRDTFARGAIRAARFLLGCSAGRYTMKDVLFGG